MVLLSCLLVTCLICTLFIKPQTYSFSVLQSQQDEIHRRKEGCGRNGRSFWQLFGRRFGHQKAVSGGHPQGEGIYQVHTQPLWNRGIYSDILSVLRNREEFEGWLAKTLYLCSKFFISSDWFSYLLALRCRRNMSNKMIILFIFHYLYIICTKHI